MIISPKGVELRNLEEQVLKNKEDIANHYNRDRVLADFGIRVIGQVDTAEDLEDKVGEEFGDAYLVGAEEPYSFYVWTRANIDAGHPEDYWLDIGPIAIQGPVGPQGPQGIQGPRGSNFTVGKGLPGVIFSGTPGDVYMVANDYGAGGQNGDVFVLRRKNGSLVYERIGNLRGAQGEVGPQGPKGNTGATGAQGPQGPIGPEGPQGKFVTVRGILSNAAQLPTPASLDDLTVAYLVGIGNVKFLYIQIGETPETAQWNNVGPFNVGSIVTENGSFVSTFDADTKLDKDLTTINATTGNIPIFGNSGVPVGSVKMSNTNVHYSIMVRDEADRVFVGNPLLTAGAPTYYAVNRQYVDNHVGGAVCYNILAGRMRAFPINCSGVHGSRTDVPAGFYKGTGNYTVSSGDEVTVTIQSAAGTIWKTWTGKFMNIVVSPADDNQDAFRITVMYYNSLLEAGWDTFYLNPNLKNNSPQIKFQTGNTDAYLHYQQASPFRLKPSTSSN